MRPQVRPHTGTALGVAGFATTILTLLAAFLVVALWTALTVYALVKWIGSAPESASPTTVLLIVVALVTAFALAITLPIVLIGRSMTPRRRRKDRGEPPPADPDAQRTETS